MNKKICLIGNANCGKTTLFNRLTGTYQKVGNWTGVTTQSKEGQYRFDKSIKVIDLPGIYSLNSASKDEEAVIDYLKRTPPDAIINIIDGTNLERSLFLTVKLCQLKIPLVIAINFIDRVKRNNIKIFSSKLEKDFGVPVVEFSALKNININTLIQKAISVENKPKLDKVFNIDAEIYTFIEQNLHSWIIKKQTKTEIITNKLDNILLHKIWGIPIFFCVLLTMYFVSMKVGGLFSDLIKDFFSRGSKGLKNFLSNKIGLEWLISLICDAILNGLGTVFAFLPQILVLFFFLTILEQSGYSSRVAFLFDGFFAKFGLGGRSIIPIMLSSGCAVSGIMATRTIEKVGERRLTIFLSPFMPCGAKLAVFGWFSYTFFNKSALIATSLYFISIISVAVFGSILKRFKPFLENSGAFILEMPFLSFPQLRDIFLVLYEKVKEFTIKAGTIIFSMSILLWFFKNFGVSGYIGNQVEKSFLFYIGNAIKYIFSPLGFGNWQASVSLLSSIVAKEAVIESMEIICTDFHSLFSSVYSVYAFMVFTLLSPPCVATLITAKRELKNTKLFVFMLIFQFLSAYIMAFIINSLSIFNSLVHGLLLYLIIGIILLATTISFRCVFKNKCASCRQNKKCRGETSQCKNTKPNTTI